MTNAETGRRIRCSPGSLVDRLRSPLLALALIVLFAGTALATAPSGFVGTLTSRATLSDTVDVGTGAIKFKTKRAVDFVTATVNFDAPSSSGWHSHPGIVLVSVVSGSVVFYDSNCVATVHPAGSSFVESGHRAGLARNESTTTPRSSTQPTSFAPGPRTPACGSTWTTPAASSRRTHRRQIQRGPPRGGPRFPLGVQAATAEPGAQDTRSYHAALADSKDRQPLLWLLGARRRCGAWPRQQRCSAHWP